MTTGICRIQRSLNLTSKSVPISLTVLSLAELAVPYTPQHQPRERYLDGASIGLAWLGGSRSALLTSCLLALIFGSRSASLAITRTLIGPPRT